MPARRGEARGTLTGDGRRNSPLRSLGVGDAEHDALVIGGGQAGLASSYHLRRRGIDHVVLESGSIGESWRSRRWDSFPLVTPSWMIALPDLPASVGGRGDPDGCLPRAGIVEMLTAWAATFTAPVHEGVTVTSVTRGPGGVVEDAVRVVDRLLDVGREVVR